MLETYKSVRMEISNLIESYRDLYQQDRSLIVLKDMVTDLIEHRAVLDSLISDEVSQSEFNPE